MAKTTVLIVGGSNQQELVEAIVSRDGNLLPLESCAEIDREIAGYSWRLDNKYYTADIRVCRHVSATNPMQLPTALSESVDALIMLFDHNDVTSFNALQSWLSFIDEHEPSILLCVGRQKKSSNIVCVDDVLQWCLQHGIEYVMWDECTTTATDEDTTIDTRELNGVDRVRESLHSNMWNGMIMKDRESITTITSTDCDSAAAAAAVSASSNERTDMDRVRSILNGVHDINLEADDGDEGQVDGIESLLGRLSMLREMSAGMPDDQRKDFAESIAMQFCQFLEGDDGNVGNDDVSTNASAYR